MATAGDHRARADVLITRLMAVMIVDLLEMIDIEQSRAKQSAGRPMSQTGLAGALGRF